MSDEVQKTKMFLAYIGPCPLSGGGKGSEWAVVEDVSAEQDSKFKFKVTDQRRVYGGTSHKGAKVGSVYSFDATADEKRSIYPNSRRWAGMVEEKLRLEWEADFDEDKREADAKKIEEATKVLLQPLREQYKGRIGYAARAAYLAKIITYITG